MIFFKGDRSTEMNDEIAILVVGVPASAALLLLFACPFPVSVQLNTAARCSAC
jgi:hypothetical protein